jgi:hypothetical protein
VEFANNLDVHSDEKRTCQKRGNCYRLSLVPEFIDVDLDLNDFLTPTITIQQHLQKRPRRTLRLAMLDNTPNDAVSRRYTCTTIDGGILRPWPPEDAPKSNNF